MQQPEVVFYVLASSAQHERQDFACRLIEKIYRGEQYCYVMVDDERQADELDKTLWTFRAGSFVPHQRYQNMIPAFQQTILIGKRDIPEGWQRIILNLSTDFPNITTSTERVIEILDNSEECKRAGRERYRHYLSASFNITTHKQEAGKWFESRTRR